MNVVSIATKILNDAFPGGTLKNTHFFLILSGGGAYLDFYKKIGDLPFWKLFDSHVTLQDFPVPADLRDFTGKDHFHRLSVAYGLAFGPVELAKISVNDLGSYGDLPQPDIDPNKCLYVDLEGAQCRNKPHAGADYCGRHS